MAKKYIDAELIKSTRALYFDIDACITELIRARTEQNEENEGKALFRMEGLMVATMQQLDCIIDSLQQEQPAKRGYKDCNGCEYNRLLKDQIGWQFRGCFGGDYKGKPIAEIELCPLKVAKQEQLSEELEEEIKRYIPRDQCPVPDLMEAVARHFYEFGKQAKKED